MKKWLAILLAMLLACVFIVSYAYAEGLENIDDGEYAVEALPVEVEFELTADEAETDAHAEEEWAGEQQVMASPASDFVFKDWDPHWLDKYIGPGGDVEIPNGVVTIGGEAFTDCISLTNINIPDSVTDIGDGMGLAFGGCTGLKTVTIPDSVKNIWRWSFCGCSNLESVKLPSGLTEITHMVFANTGLKSISIPSTVKSIESLAFNGCDKLTSIVIPEGVTIIEEQAFGGCNSLKEVTLPKSLTSIADNGHGYVFQGYDGEDVWKLDMTVTAPCGSYAAKWAADYGCVVNLTDHTLVTDPGYPATSTAAGLTDGSHCSVCGEVIVAQQTIPALGYPQIAVEALKNKGAVTLSVGEVRQIVPAFATASGWTVTGYQSGKPKVATVDGNGILTAVAEGKAKITITTEQKKKATITIQVIDPYKPTGVSIAQGKEITVPVGQAFQLNTGLAPAGAQATLTWKSSKPGVATVDGNGLVSPVAEGTAKISVQTHNKKKATITVKVVDPHKPTGVSIAQGKAITVAVGQRFQLSAGLAPAGAQATLTWTSKKPKVATVDGNGWVNPVAEGTAKITVQTHNKKKASITVKVVDPHKPSGVSIAQGKAVTIKVGQALQLNANLNPAGARSALTWKSGKPAVATVDGGGLVRGVKKGKTKITVTTYNKKKATITVNVVE